MKKYIFFAMACVFLACSQQAKHGANSNEELHQSLQKLSDSITTAEINDDLASFISHYDAQVISMPEYQPTLTGTNQVESFYKEIFLRQNIKNFKRTHDEFIDMDSIIIELGTFRKEFTTPTSDSLVIHNGKYAFVWKRSLDGKFKISAETYGFFHPIENPGTLVVRELMPAKTEPYREEEIPFELRAYNALMEKYVARSGSGALRAEFFATDGKFFPFAHPAVSSMSEIKPYLIKYDTHGPGFKFDSISVWTFHHQYIDDYVLEYSKFLVRWSVPGSSGGTSGKGIRIWKRQQDHTLKLFREIGTHNLD